MPRRPSDPRPEQEARRRAIEREFEGPGAPVYTFDAETREVLEGDLGSLAPSKRDDLIFELEHLVRAHRGLPLLPSTAIKAEDLSRLKRAVENVDRILAGSAGLQSNESLSRLHVHVRSWSAVIAGVVADPPADGRPKDDIIRQLVWNVGCRLISAGVVLSQDPWSPFTQCLVTAINETTAPKKKIGEDSAVYWVKVFQAEWAAFRDVGLSMSPQVPEYEHDKNQP